MAEPVPNWVQAAPPTTPVEPAPTPAAAPTLVTVQAPSGEYGTIPADNLQAAVQAGYRPETENETAAREMSSREGLLGGVKAFGENAASTATLGLSDVVAGGIGGNDYRRNRALREMAYPTASTAGEVAGMIAPALIPGGAEAEAAEGAAGAAEAAHEGGTGLMAALGKGASYTPSGLALRAGEGASELAGHALGGMGIAGDSLLGRLALSGGKLAAGGAAEGALFGAGSALSEAALAPDGDYDDLAHRLWAGGIEGAEFGAITGGALGGAGELVGAAARKIGGTFSARQALQELGDAKTLKSAGYLGRDIGKLSTEQRSKLADVLRNQPEIGWADSLTERAGKLKEAKQTAGEALGRMREHLDEIAGPGEGPQVRHVLDDVDQRVKALRDDAVTADDTRLADKLDRYFDEARQRMAPKQEWNLSVEAGGRRMVEPGGVKTFDPTFKWTTEFRKKIDDALTNYGAKRFPGTAPTAFEKELRNVRFKLEDEFEGAAQKVMDRAAADGSGSVTPDFIAKYHDAKANYGALKEISKVTEKRAGMAAGNRDIGLTDTIAGAAGYAAMGPGGLLAAAANKAIRSTQADHVIGKLADALARVDDRISQSMSKWTADSRKAAKSVVESPPRAHHQAVKEAIAKGKEVSKTGISSSIHVRLGATEQAEKIKDYYETLNHAEAEQNSPPGTLVHIPDAPKTQAAAEKVRRQNVSWLLSQAPVPPGTITQPLLARLARQMPPTVGQIESFNRKVKVVEDPLSVLPLIASGRLTADHVKALEATNPPILEKIRQVAIEHATNSHEDMAYRDKMQLGILLGAVTDPSLRPESIQAGQAPYKARAAMQAAANAPGGGPSAPSVQGKTPQGSMSRVDELEEGTTIH